MSKPSTEAGIVIKKWPGGVMGGLPESVLSATCPQQQPQKGTGQQGRKRSNLDLWFFCTFLLFLSAAVQRRLEMLLAEFTCSEQAPTRALWLMACMGLIVSERKRPLWLQLGCSWWEGPYSIPLLPPPETICPAAWAEAPTNPAFQPSPASANTHRSLGLQSRRSCSLVWLFY